LLALKQCFDLCPLTHNKYLEAQKYDYLLFV